MAEEKIDTDTGELLTPQKVADKLAVSPSTVKRWIQRGILPGLRLVKGYRVHRSAFMKFLGERTLRQEKD